MTGDELGIKVTKQAQGTSSVIFHCCIKTQKKASYQ